ncbi:MAG: hypothetical protein QOI56_1566, partial [Actinomycetota bacterium]|nr:hypothetical protein [Actinomycetota bacterium]
MPSPLVIPGVQVRTQFEPSPSLPGATGILGLVGVADRGPTTPTPVGSAAELAQLFGAATRFTMPEVRTAFANGVARAWIARISPGRGTKASVLVNDREGEPVVRFVARAEGAWGNQVAVRIKPVLTLSGAAAKYVDVEVLFRGEVVDRIHNLVMDPDSPNNLFSRVNAESRLVVAVDPEFDTQLPRALARSALTDLDARAAFATLKAGATDAVRVESKRVGRAGNQLAVMVQDGRAARAFDGPGNAPSVEISARKPGLAGTDIQVTVQPSGPDSVNVVVIAPGVGARQYGPLLTVDALVQALAADPDVRAQAKGAVLPSPVNQQRLQRRVDVTVFAEGKDPRVYAGLGQVADLIAINDPAVVFTAIGATPALPSADTGTALAGGRNKGPALPLGADEASDPLVELVPAPGAGGTLEVAVTQGTSSIDGSTAVVGLTVFVDGAPAETFSDTSMDPDDPRYLPALLESSSQLVRAVDLSERSRTTSFPNGSDKPFPLKDGVAPTTDDYQEALDRLEAAEDVDLVIASVANELPDAQVRTVHQAVVAHCTKMADVARCRIGLGSVTDAEAPDFNAVLDHADDVRSDHFVLVAPARLEGAVAGLLGRQDYFQSPTFKTIASPDARPGTYSDAQLEQLVTGNTLVVNERRRLGIIVVKGVLTSGMQINVRRTANKAVRDVKATADRYVGLLNNDGTRNALLQQINALLFQMARDGALVPSTDGLDP